MTELCISLSIGRVSKRFCCSLIPVHPKPKATTTLPKYHLSLFIRPAFKCFNTREARRSSVKPVEGLYYPVYLSAHIKWPETYELLEALSDTQPYQAPTPTLLRMSARLLPPEDSARGMQMPNVIGQKTVEVRSRKPKP